MTERELDISDMKCWVFQMAQSQWKITSQLCSEIFKKYDILGFISDCFDFLSYNSHNCALHDVETLLKNKNAPEYDMIAPKEDRTEPPLDFTESRKHYMAVCLMRDSIFQLAKRENISYEDALFLFTSSKIYDALFDYGTGIYREGTDYILNLFDRSK